MNNMLKRTLKTQGVQQMPQTIQRKSDFGVLISEFLESVTSVHKAHLKVTGPGSFAAHKAMGEFYDEIGDLADGIAESYQGLTETLLEIPQIQIKSCSTAQDCVDYLNSLYDKVCNAQDACSYSEINNELDNVKTLINSTKYKLIFLQ